MNRFISEVLVISRIKKIADEIAAYIDKNVENHRLKDKLVVSEINVLDVCNANLRDAEIVIIDGDLLSNLYKEMPNLKWAHCTWAGVEPLFINIKKQPKFIVTRHSHEYFGERMAEYVLSHILNIENDMKSMSIAQENRSWFDLKDCYLRSNHRLLKDLAISILGVGNMGQAIARFFHKVSEETIVRGFARTPREEYHLSPFHSIETSLGNVISDADYIINTLPSTPETCGLLDGDVLQICHKKPVFINVGRGDIIKEHTILKALEKEWISHAVLDVFKEEPLDHESMLWNTEKVTITPHIAAESTAKNIAEDFIRSFHLYIENKPMRNVVDWNNSTEKSTDHNILNYC